MMSEKQVALVELIGAAREDLGQLRDDWSDATRNLGVARCECTEAERLVKEAEKYLERKVWDLVDSIGKEESHA